MLQSWIRAVVKFQHDITEGLGHEATKEEPCVTGTRDEEEIFLIANDSSVPFAISLPTPAA